MFKERNRTCWEHGLGNIPGRLTGSWLAQRNKLILESLKFNCKFKDYLILTLYYYYCKVNQLDTVNGFYGVILK